MSEGRRIPLSQAQTVADQLLNLVFDTCLRIEIAGSIRRGLETIGDIELVVIPRTDVVFELPDTDMFGNPLGEAKETNLSLFDARCADLLRDGSLALRPRGDGKTAWGASYKGGIFRGVNVDLFTATRQTWGCIFLIRTGPNDFSRRLVTDRRHGGLCPSHMQFKDGRLRYRSSGEPFDTPEEQHVFETMGYRWLSPEKRFPTTTPAAL
jgi:DNA polymerase/3'-5' exonuclease PolX